MMIHREMVRRGERGVLFTGEADPEDSNGVGALVELSKIRDQDKGRWRYDVTRVTLPVPTAGYEAYNLNCMIGRSNMLSLEEMMSEAVEDIEGCEAGFGVGWRGYGGSITMELWNEGGNPLRGARELAKVWQEFTEAIEGYPLIDEDLYSRLGVAQQNMEAEEFTGQMLGEFATLEFGEEIYSEDDSELTWSQGAEVAAHALWILSREGYVDEPEWLEWLDIDGRPWDWRYDMVYREPSEEIRLQWLRALAWLLAEGGVSVVIDEDSGLYDDVE